MANFGRYSYKGPQIKNPMVKVGLAQIEITENSRKNLEKILNYIEDAAKQGADVVCFPEACLITNPLFIEPLDLFLAEIQKKCKEHNIWCIVGSYVDIYGTFNSTFIFNREGKLIYEYKKVHVMETEKDIIPGVSNQVVNTDFGDMAVICSFDCLFPEYIQDLSTQGAKIIFCPSNLKGLDFESFFRAVPQVRSFENMAYFALCDVFHKSSLSYVASPEKVLGKIDGKEGLLVVDLDIEKINKLRKKFSFAST